jgi:hypothetical protein
MNIPTEEVQCALHRFNTTRKQTLSLIDSSDEQGNQTSKREPDAEPKGSRGCRAAESHRRRPHRGSSSSSSHLQQPHRNLRLRNVLAIRSTGLSPKSPHLSAWANTITTISTRRTTILECHIIGGTGAETIQMIQGYRYRRPLCCSCPQEAHWKCLDPKGGHQRSRVPTPAGLEAY